MKRPPDRPLRDTTVVDVSRMLPGAILARMLADLGARVIKVESPAGGDPLRSAAPLVDGVGAGFCAFYRGAESLCLDLRRPREAQALCALAGHADVLVESFRPGTMEAWGAGPEKLLALHPALIVCSLSGFGAGRPVSDLVAHDINIVAWSGLSAMLPGEGVPRVQLADVATGILACSAVLAALLGRARSGRGGWIDQPLASGPLPFMTMALAETAAGGRSDADAMLGGACPAYRFYVCGDGGRLAVGAVEPKFWTSFAEVLGLPEIASVGLDPGPEGREAARRVERKLATHARDHWLPLFRARGLPVAPVNDAPAALAALREAGMTEELPAPGGGSLSAAGPYLPSLGATPSRAAPRLGEHTAAILAELGLAPGPA